MPHLTRLADVGKEFLLVVHILAAAAAIGRSLFAGVSFAAMGSSLGLKSLESAETEDLSAFRRLMSVGTLAHMALFTVAVWAMVVKRGS